jgi:Zn finger protein HypA/HybF involved in hydrogenase expression
MHDFLLAKEIFDELDRIIQENNFSCVKKVYIEIGQVSMAHDGHSEHAEDISLDNLQFGLESIIKNTPLENTVFSLQKVAGNDWKITDIEVE